MDRSFSRKRAADPDWTYSHVAKARLRHSEQPRPVPTVPCPYEPSNRNITRSPLNQVHIPPYRASPTWNGPQSQLHPPNPQNYSAVQGPFPPYHTPLNWNAVPSPSYPPNLQAHPIHHGYMPPRHISPSWNAAPGPLNPPNSQRGHIVETAARPVPAVAQGPTRAFPSGPSPAPKPCSPVNPQKTVVYTPRVCHSQHPDSKNGQEFHWVPYPLGLMPYDSWSRLHNPIKANLSPPFRCPKCGTPRKVTAHARKLFLVAERLTWQTGVVPTLEKDQNEQLTWEVNYELGILDPFVEDPEQVPGGKKSQTNRWYPYQNAYELKQAFDIIFISDTITEASWSLWISMQNALQNMLDENEEKPKAPVHDERHVQSVRRPLETDASNRNVTVSADLASAKKPPLAPTFGILKPTPSFSNPLSENHNAATWSAGASSSRQGAVALPQPPPAEAGFNNSLKIVSYKTLQDFYSLLDQIERTSFVGALFLEAYAEYLSKDKCRGCWLKNNVEQEVQTP